MKYEFYFADIVVVEDDMIGCIVKTWDASPTGSKRGIHYEVYVRSWNAIREYDENQIKRYVVSKELSEEEQQWH